MSSYKQKKNLLFSLIVLIGVVGIFELSSFAFFKIRKDRFSFSDPSEFTLNDEEIARVAKSFNYSLGWKIIYNTPIGERPRAKNYEENFGMCFGDSFTYCVEVKDNETWQEYLSKKLKKNVYNLGNGAYGTDQVLLRFREDHEKVNTKYITLGIITENINRLVNIYRKFYLPSTGIPATKPRFILQGDRLTLLENPIKNISDLQKLKNDKFIMEIGANDYWYNRSKRPHFSFPYSFILFNKNIWSEIKNGKRGDEIDTSDPMIIEDLWKDQNARELMFKIIDSFVNETKQSDAVPVILVFPMDYEIFYKIKTGDSPFTILYILNYCQSKGYNVFCPIKELAEEVIFEKNYDLFKKWGHYSANGNKILAKYLYLYFEKLNKR